MRPDVARALHRINLAFYAQHAADFDAARRDPWPGWDRVAASLRGSGPLHVLDVGCGNARLAEYLAARLPRPLVYRGVDASASLLALARARLEGVDAELLCADVTEAGDPWRIRGAFELVAVFGLLHHVPGADRRRNLVRALAQRVAPGGRLALAIWDFGAHERFMERHVDWVEHGIDPADVEPGDALLRWGPPGSDRSRYCHWIDADEEAQLLEDLDLELIDAWSSDGRGAALNRYRVLGRLS
jgi:SAM-dependent methyltransferase